MKKYLFGNWKMNMSLKEIAEFRKLIKGKLCKSLCVGVAVPSVYFGYCQKLQKQILVGLQNVSEFDNGAYTGEISAQMAQNVNADFCLVGHSERRQHFNETNAQISKKIKKLQDNNVLPILCIGETLEEYESGQTRQVLQKQLKKGLDGVDKYKQIIVAYEPVWAIGTGRTASLQDINSISKFIKEQILGLFGKNYPAVVLYGGSVKPENSKEIVNLEFVDGALVGGASQDANKFKQIIESFN